MVPRHLFVSGAPAPHLPRRHVKLSELSGDALFEQLKTYGGTPMEVLENPEMRELIFPMLRADFKIVEDYRCSDDHHLDVATSVLGGDRDPLVAVDDLLAWTSMTRTTHQNVYAGDHFYLHPHGDSILAHINDTLM